MTDGTESGIIESILAGETRLFEVLIRRYNGLLYKIARGYGFNHHDSEDLMQETHLAAYKNLGQFGGRSSYKTWIAKIMVHKCLYQLNHGSARKEQPLTDKIGETDVPAMNHQNQNEEVSLLNREFSRLLENSLQQIPFDYRTVFILRMSEGFSIAETSALLNITPINVKVRLNRAKAMLQKQLEQYYSTSEIYEFNLIYCDRIVSRVFEKINEYANNH